MSGSLLLLSLLLYACRGCQPRSSAQLKFFCFFYMHCHTMTSGNHCSMWSVRVRELERVHCHMRKNSPYQKKYALQMIAHMHARTQEQERDGEERNKVKEERKKV